MKKIFIILLGLSINVKVYSNDVNLDIVIPYYVEDYYIDKNSKIQPIITLSSVIPDSIHDTNCHWSAFLHYSYKKINLSHLFVYDDKIIDNRKTYFYLNTEELKDTIYGGEMDISVKCDDKAQGNKTILIKGANPSYRDVENYINNSVLKKIACVESHFRQFNAEIYNGTNSYKSYGLPLIGKDSNGNECGIGMMQLCDPPAMEKSIWNWRKNVDQAKIIYDEKLNQAKGLRSSELRRLNKKRKSLGLENCKFLSEIPEELLQRETIRRYNGCRELRWQSTYEASCEGYWVIDPTIWGECDYNYVEKIMSCQ